MEYTKGKWYVSLNGKVLVKDGAQFIEICDMPFSSAREADEMPESSANANLIAAAPAMYEALKAFMVDYNNKSTVTIADHDLMLVIQQAIAKAEGK